MIRPLKGIENIFSNPNSQDNILLGIKFTDSKYVLQVAENFKKIFSGLRLQVTDGKYYRKKEQEIPIYKIPNWIQDCKSANLYVFNNQMVPYTESLASLSMNDKILVVSSSHALSDGGYMVSVLSRCMDDFSQEKANNEAPLYSSDAFKEEFNEAEKKFDKKIIWPMDKLTTCKYDTNDSHLAPPGTQYIENEVVIPVEKLACYNKKTKKPQSLSDVSCVGVAMSILALNKVNHDIDFTYNEPLSLTAILDVRRFSKNKSKIDWRFGNCIAQPTIKAEVTKNDTIEDVAKKIRDYINLLKPHGVFYCAGHMSELLNKPPKAIIGCHSGIGPIKFKRPIVDFDLRDCIRLTPGKGDHGEQHGTMFGVISYSKVNEFRNDLCYVSRIWPSCMTIENGKILCESFKYFITKVPISASFDSALHDLINFQRSVKKSF
ncbi:hypothetical protein M9Y10_038553 [Tritrichomonas musculus]|uniref:Uncharacterized protein n=1 Tax=Tritrichomonas musculus TaxID=1915356 RepID=A0ABR2K8Q3_9EUKA